MTRIVAGAAGGRTLRVPPGAGTRPTSDRVREALFSRLEALDVVDGARVLDLYAGSGALGLEAVSRGAASAVLVESARAAAAVARANAAALGLPEVRVVADRVERYLAAASPAGFDLVFADPPYPLGEQDLAAVLAALAPALAPRALVVVERSSRSPEPTWPAGWEVEDSRRYGETALWSAGPS
ncbi:16S rRNA (guanine966-N2)-methyltransferase [Kineococcus xinjiangensis]|uniref:16S rRNA (Guanine966-N2)-methyltransferase n=1 Tax=Kineococcus xinjiangensis TaxID=512762 RepID=A0A2S6IW24_9ACTN|nr:16S rRNA (guanine(966)-N(2))-methyltransferase RsmD [Kineococcus xinjiangensis]PPK98548.1 16S rRNA (guanine966-N2)-methyltransferase [Kineococcus xinjiangensis]